MIARRTRELEEKVQNNTIIANPLLSGYSYTEWRGHSHKEEDEVHLICAHAHAGDVESLDDEDEILEDEDDLQFCERSMETGALRVSAEERPRRYDEIIANGSIFRDRYEPFCPGVYFEEFVVPCSVKLTPMNSYFYKSRTAKHYTWVLDCRDCVSLEKYVYSPSLEIFLDLLTRKSALITGNSNRKLTSMVFGYAPTRWRARRKLRNDVINEKRGKRGWRMRLIRRALTSRSISHSVPVTRRFNINSKACASVGGSVPGNKCQKDRRVEWDSDVGARRYYCLEGS